MLIRLDVVRPHERIYNMKVQENGVVNGAIVKKGDYDGYDYFKAEKNTDASAEELVMLVAPFMDYTGLEEETNFTFKKGDVVRGYGFEKNDIITVTIGGITSATNVKSDMVGKFVEVADGSYKMGIQSAKTASLAFKVIDVDTLDGKDALVLEVQ